MRHGKGSIQFEDGSVYHGYWNYGEPERGAVLRTADGRQVRNFNQKAVGEWINGELVKKNRYRTSKV